MERYWLAVAQDLGARFSSLKSLQNASDRWDVLRALARKNMDYGSTMRLDRAIRREQSQARSGVPQRLLSVKLAILSTSTTSHLAAGLTVAGLGRDLLLEIYEPHYGQARQEITDSNSSLHAFAPSAVLFAEDPYSLFGYHGFGLLDDGKEAARDAVRAQRTLWRRARELWDATILQQVPFNPMPRLMGENEGRLPGSPASLVRAYQDQLRLAAAEEGVDLIDIDYWAARGGLPAWHSVALWNRSKHYVHPSAAAFYGDLVARSLAARRGRSAKCLVLDLDNTLWGGVVGDDGIEGIILGQGSAGGEGYLAFQAYAKQLSKRGVILAVCSKNDDAVARSPFQSHPDMLLRLEDIGCFVANWTDKATNLRHIASELNIGIDLLVFVDDNPFERELVRRELPDVFVPEMTDEPSEYAAIVADSGYFEGVVVTRDDLARSEQYQSNARRRVLKENTADIGSYLATLEMTLKHSAFDKVGMSRIVQLINKTNQFNLTTRRYTDDQVAHFLRDPNAVTRQFRLIDRYGDNGIIAIIIAFHNEAELCLEIDTWLMSCRVLGRQVENATLRVMVEIAKAIGAQSLIGRYVPTDRNGMVRDHYATLGFKPRLGEQSGAEWILQLAEYVPTTTSIKIEEV